jgi:putative tryptophan/tyrosine transport system substrate-binding protein
MKRREFITLLGGAAAWPMAARAQQQSMPLIAFLSSGSPNTLAPERLAAFKEALQKEGFIEGRNVAFEYRFADNQYDRVPRLIDDLLKLKPAVVVANYPPVLAVKAGTSTIPILFIAGGDPIKRGLVNSLKNPGGNLTGVSNLNSELMPKRIELLHELLPAVTALGLLINPTNPAAR